MKVVAIDFGEKRVGMAVSDPDGRMALALPVYEMKGDGRDAERVAGIVREQEAEGVVIGLPLNMDGTEGPAVARVREFARDLGEHLGLAIEFRDERLTSDEAERRIREAPMSRKKRRGHVNTVAAQIILEAFLKEKA